MPRSTYKDKPSTKKSIKYVIDEKSKRDFFRSSYCHMLIQDLHLGIMPIRGRSENPKFSVKIDPASKQIEELIKLGLCTYHGKPHSLAEAFCDFIDEATHYLASFGKAYYEISYFYTNENKNKIEGFIIESIPNHCVKETMGFYWQFIPKKSVRYRERNFKRFVWLSKKDLLILSIPKELGGVKKHNGLLSDLYWLSECIQPKFVLEDMKLQKQTKGYNFSIYRSNHEIFLAKASKHLGWTARGMFSERSLEFYIMYRYLKFAKTRAILREYILHNLNRSLETIGAKIGFNVKIRLEGIPSNKDYDLYIKQLVEGSLQFSDVVRLMRI